MIVQKNLIPLVPVSPFILVLLNKSAGKISTKKRAFVTFQKRIEKKKITSHIYNHFAFSCNLFQEFWTFFQSLFEMFTTISKINAIKTTINITVISHQLIALIMLLQKKKSKWHHLVGKLSKARHLTSSSALFFHSTRTRRIFGHCGSVQKFSKKTPFQSQNSVDRVILP